MINWTVRIQKTPTQCKTIRVSGAVTSEEAVISALNAMKWTMGDCISVTAELTPVTGGSVPTPVVAVEQPTTPVETQYEPQEAPVKKIRPKKARRK